MCCKKNWNIFRRLINLKPQEENLNFILKLPYKNKVIRKMVLFLLSAFCFLLSTFCISCDKEEMLYGTWNLQTVLMNDESLNDSLQFNVIPRYTYYKFFFANSLTVSTYALGKTTSSSDGKYIYKGNSYVKMNFTIFEKSYEITAKIKKITQKELHLEYDDHGNHYFLKLYK